MEEAGSNRLMVGVGIGEYEHLEPLAHATGDVEQLAERLADHGFETFTSLDQPHGEVVDGLREAIPKNRLGEDDSVLIVLWSGHATPNPHSGSLRLLTTESKGEDLDIGTVNADELAEVAALSQAAQMLILIDTCWSGDGVIDMATVVDTVEQKGFNRSRRWIGIVASCQDYERAVDGALAAKLLDLLREGPDNRELRLRWSSYQAGLRGDDLVDALLKEWDEPQHSPKALHIGSSWFLMDNPLYDANAPERVVEHLLWAARGASQSEEGGVWFVGREQPLRRIVAWINEGEAGLCTITGSAGCGKSAVAGRLVSLSNSAERKVIEEAQGLPAKGLDPGEGTIATHLQLRGMTLKRCVEILARDLGVIGTRRVVNQHDILSWVAGAESRLTIVIDGLDEAGREGFKIAEELLAPLARYALVIVASREVQGEGAGGSLLTSLGGPALGVDLDDDSESTDRDVQGYVSARLRGPAGEPLDAKMEPELVAREVVALARPEGGREGPFLLARIVTGQLISRPVDTSSPAWRERIAQTAEQALDQDLELGSSLRRDDEELPQAGRELLTALAYSHGSGFPADDVWPTVATALSPAKTAYERLDAFWALSEYGRYVTVSSQNGQAVYRLHERLAASLRKSLEESFEDGTARTAAAAAVLSVYEEFLERGKPAASHPYLWLNAWQYAVDGGNAGIEMLEWLAEKDPALRPSLAAALSALGLGEEEAAPPEPEPEPAPEASPKPSIPPLAEKEHAAASDLAAEPGGREEPPMFNEMADSLSNLGSRYTKLGRHAEAVETTEQAVEIYEELAQENPDFRSDLAGALNDLGSCYREVGRRSDAVPPTERAVEIYEGLAEESDGYRGDLARALDNLGNRYNETGRYSEAIPPAERAVKIYEGLAQESDAYSGRLVGALNNLGTSYSAVGRRAEAVETTEQAVEIATRLAGDDPALLPDLASALNNLGNRYSETGRRSEALVPAERAVEIITRLAAENPAFLPDLASALNNLSNCYADLGRATDAVEPIERAVEAREELAAENPAFLPDLAMALNNLGNRYGEIGRRSDAIPPTERAVTIYEELAKQNPVFLYDLAGGLNNLAIRYSEVKRESDATPILERAAGLWEQLAKENPAFLASLAMTLNNLGNRYSALGRQADALAVTERSVQLREQLAAENPGSLADLASALNNLGNRYAELGRGAEALEPAERSVDIYEELAVENRAFLDNLSRALNNLDGHYRGLGRSSEAAQRWDAAYERFSSNPHAGLVLRLYRARVEDEGEDAINDLIEAFELDPGDEPRLTASLHRSCRTYRSEAQGQFDRAWKARLGEPPAWLLLDEAVLSACAEWVDAPTWAESRDYLASKAELLVSEAGRTALAEIALLVPDSPYPERHLAILDACEREGIDAAFREYLIGETVAPWMAIEDPEESKRFLLEHREDLLTPEAMSILVESKDLTRAALLEVARTDSIELACELLVAPDSREAAMVSAAREGRFDSLREIAAFCQGVEADSAKRVLALTYMAIGLTATGLEERAGQMLRELDLLQANPGPAIDLLTGVIAAHPEHAAGFAGMIRVLNETAITSKEGGE